MDKLSKIFLVIIIILIIALTAVTCLYLNVRTDAYKYREYYVYLANELVELNAEHENNQNT